MKGIKSDYRSYFLLCLAAIKNFFWSFVFFSTFTPQEGAMESSTQLEEVEQQLESELRTTKELLQSEQTKKEEYKSALESLKREVTTKTEQWENDIQQQKCLCAASTKELLQAQQVNNRNEDIIKQLRFDLCRSEEKLHAVSKLYDDSQRELEVCNDLIKGNESLADALQQQSKDTLESCNATISNLETQLSEAAEVTRKLSATREQLEVQIAKVKEENSTLKEHLQTVSYDAQRLLKQAMKLSETNSSLERSKSDLEASISVTSEENGLLKAQLKAVNQMVSDTESKRKLVEEELTEKNTHLDSARQDVTQRLAEALEIANSQSMALSQLGEKYKLIRTEKEAGDAKVAELTNTIITLNDEYKKEVNRRVASVDEAVSLREQLASVLSESNEIKVKFSKDALSLREDYNKLASSTKESALIAERKYDQLTQSHGNLIGVIFDREQWAVASDERVGRSQVVILCLGGVIDMLEEHNSMLQKSLKRCTQCICEKENIIEMLRSQLQEEKANLDAQQQQCASHLQSLEKIKEASLEEKASLQSLRKNLEVATASNSQLENDKAYLTRQVDSLTKELNEVDAIVVAQVNDLQGMNDNLKQANADLKKGNSELALKNDQLSTEGVRVLSQLEKISVELTIKRKTLQITENELMTAQGREKELSSSLSDLSNKLTAETTKGEKLYGAVQQLQHTDKSLRDQLNSAAEKFNVVLSEKRSEIESLTNQLKKSFEVIGRHESSITDYQTSLDELKNANAKLKAHCSADNNSLKELAKEKVQLVQERDAAVGKYNSLCASVRSCRSDSQLSTQLRNMVALCTAQEEELQKFRRECPLLKKSLLMCIEQPEEVFTESLNLTEGPLRHPKKRIESH